MKIKRFNEFINESITDNIYYHSSDVKFDKFSIDKVGSKGGVEWGGYHGLYITDNIKYAERHGKYTYKIKLDDNANILSGEVTPTQIKQIYNELVKESYYIKPNQSFYLNPVYGEYAILSDVMYFYEYLMNTYNMKHHDISKFLFRCGIDGMQIDSDNSIVLVIFNDNIMDIVDVYENENKYST